MRTTTNINALDIHVGLKPPLDIRFCSFWCQMCSMESTNTTCSYNRTGLCQVEGPVWLQQEPWWESSSGCFRVFWSRTPPGTLSHVSLRVLCCECSLQVVVGQLGDPLERICLCWCYIRLYLCGKFTSSCISCLLSFTVTYTRAHVLLISPAPSLPHSLNPPPSNVIQTHRPTDLSPFSSFMCLNKQTA